MKISKYRLSMISVQCISTFGYSWWWKKCFCVAECYLLCGSLHLLPFVIECSQIDGTQFDCGLFFQLSFSLCVWKLLSGRLPS